MQRQSGQENARRSPVRSLWSAILFRGASDDEVVHHRRPDVPDPDRGAAVHPEAVLPFRREDAGGEDRPSVSGEDLDGAAVDEDAHFLQREIDQMLPDLSLVRVEPPREAGAVHGEHIVAAAAVDADAAASVRPGEKPKIRIVASEDDFHLQAGADSLTCRHFPVPESLQPFERRLDEAPSADAELAGQGQASGPLVLVGGAGQKSQRPSRRPARLVRSFPGYYSRRPPHRSRSRNRAGGTGRPA